MTRRVYLLRHGEAGYAVSDPERELTDTGRIDTAAVVEQQVQSLFNVDRIVSSPYLRAQQTATIAQSFLPQQFSIEPSELLVPEAKPSALIEWVEGQSGHILLVGHNPLLTRVLNLWIGVDETREHMDTSSLAAVEFSISAAGCANLVWIRHRL
ncbi:MAG: histidine phosphatase family protein [Motiliproteus sp.]